MTNKNYIFINHLKISTLLIIASLLMSCGLVRNNEIKNMSTEELSNLDDQTICDAVYRQAVLSPPVDVKLMRVAQKRGLEYCIKTDKN